MALITAATATPTNEACTGRMVPAVTPSLTSCCTRAAAARVLRS
jgi:hypothetical protein